MDTATTANSEISADEEQKPVRRKRLPLIIAILAVLAAIGGGYWFMSQKHATRNDEPAQKKESAPIYVPLESITVNLQDEGSDQFLQVAMSLKVSGEAATDKLKILMPEVRNRLLFLLSSKRASELTTTIGKEKLSREIQAEVTRVLEPGAASAPPQDAGAAAVPNVPATELAASDAPSVAAAVSAGTETPAAADAKPAAAPVDSPIIGVIFTSFLIQ